MSDGIQKDGSGERDCEFRLLCVGDIHLGRRPSRIPADIEEYGVNVADTKKSKFTITGWTGNDYARCCFSQLIHLPFRDGR